MAVCDLYNREKNKIGEIELNDSVFKTDYEGKEVLVHEVIKARMAAWRAGTHATKTYNTISGGNSKPFKQKGTGRARRGTMRASTLRGGAKAFSPQPRDYTIKVNAKKRKAAVRAVLSERFATERLFVVDKFLFDAPKTKDAFNMFKNVWNLESAIVICGMQKEENFVRSVENLRDYNWIDCSEVNLYDIMNYKNIILTEEAAKHLNEVLG